MTPPHRRAAVSPGRRGATAAPPRRRNVSPQRRDPTLWPDLSVDAVSGRMQGHARVQCAASRGGDDEGPRLGVWRDGRMGRMRACVREDARPAEGVREECTSRMHVRGSCRVRVRPGQQRRPSMCATRGGWGEGGHRACFELVRHGRNHGLPCEIECLCVGVAAVPDLVERTL